jgi:hypothetical protein
MAQMGPESMYSIRPAKKGLPARSASEGRCGQSAFGGCRFTMVDEQCFSRCSLEGVTSLMATSLKPRFSKREMMGPIRPR